MPSDHDHYPFLVEISTRRGIIQEDHLRDHAGADLPVSSADVGWLSESLILLRLFIWGFFGGLVRVLTLGERRSESGNLKIKAPPRCQKPYVKCEG